MAAAINYPFGDDGEDFKIAELISRHVWVNVTESDIIHHLFNTTLQATGKILNQYKGPPVPPKWEEKQVETMVTINSINGEE